MKLRNFVLISLTILIAVVFTGCGNRYGKAVEIHQKNDCESFIKIAKIKDESVCETLASINEPIIFFLSRGEGSLATTTAINNATATALQVAAEITKQREHNYFAIVQPNKLSNFTGSLINTPEDFFQKCDIGVTNIFSFNKFPCNLHISDGRNARMAIVTYHEQPHDVLTFNATYVLEYLKTEDRYDANGKLGNYTLFKNGFADTIQVNEVN